MADLTQGISNMQGRLNTDVFGAYKSGAEAYATPVKYGQELAKGQIDLNQKAREQEIQIRLQKAIEESYDPATGQPNYDKLAATGHKYGITAQQMDYAIKHLKENWDAISTIARQKQQVGSIAKPGWNTAKTGTTTQTTGGETTGGETTTQTTGGGTTKGVASPTINEPTTAQENEQFINDSVNQVTSEPSVDGSIAVTATPKTTKPVEEAKMAPLSSDLDPFTYTEPPVPQNTLYSNVDNMEVNTPYSAGGVGGSVDGSSIKATGIVNYTVPRAGRTTLDPKTGKYVFTQYTEDELARNPALNTFKAAENFFRTRTGDNEGAIDDVARSYLASVRDNALKAESVPNPPVYPISGDPKDIDVYNERLRTWQNDNSKAIGKADKAVQDVKEAIAKGQFELADKIIDAQKSTIRLGAKEYRAYNEKARDNISSLELIEPVADHLKSQLAEFGDSSDWEGLKLLIPTVARVVGQRMNPGSQISEGNIAETSASATAEKVSAMGFSTEAILVILAEKLTNPGKDLSEIIKEFSTGALKARSPSGVAAKLRGLVEASDKSVERYKIDNLIGYGGKSGDDKQPPPSTTPSEDTPILKSGWYNRKPGEKLFESGSGKQYKVTDRDPLGYPSKAIGRDGIEYSIKDEGNRGISLWADEPTSEPTAPKAKKGNKGPVKKPETAAKKKVW